METADPLWKYKRNKRTQLRALLAPIFVFSSTFSPHATPKGIVGNRLFEGNETGRVGGTDTGTTVLDGLAGGLLAQH